MAVFFNHWLDRAERRGPRARCIAERIGLGLLLAVLGCSGARAEYVHVPARRGDLTVTLAARGSLEALNQVNVVAEVGGNVTDVYVHEGQSVESGQPLGKLDPEHWQLMVTRAEAQLAADEAALGSAQHTREAAEAELGRAEKRAAKNAKAGGEVDTARAALDKARTDEQLASSRVTVSTTALDKARTALDHTLIRSPMSGVVVSHAIEPGQTLATTASAPIVFVLARDLRRMELRVFVDEADVGRLAVGQAAQFRADGLGDQPFPARLSSIRNVALRQGQRVGFEARLEVDNAGGKLAPGMLASVDISVAERKNGVLVPNAALRYAPALALLSEQRSIGRFFRGRERGEPAPPEAQRSVWLFAGNAEPRAQRVGVGLSDGSWTEVLDGSLEAGAELVVDELVRRN